MSHFLYFFSNKDNYKKEFPNQSAVLEAAAGLTDIIPRSEVDNVAVVIHEGELPSVIMDNLNKKVKEYFSIEESQRVCSLSVFLRKTT